jgi:hypothetical protein
MTRPAVRSGNLIECKRLHRAGWWLIPYTREAVSAMYRALETLGSTRRSTILPRTVPRKRSEIHREVKRLVPEIHKERIAFYNAQPCWSLREIQVNSSSEVHQAVEEFLGLAKIAAAEFCWAMNLPVSGMGWKIHGWKHTTFAEIENIIKDLNAGHWLPPELRADLIRSAAEAEALFHRASRNEPEAVARLDFLFPSKEDKLRAGQAILDTTQNPIVPAPEFLAADWVRTAIRHPDSNEAEEARDNLRRLVSKQAAKGSRPKGGRPASQHHEEIVSTIWMMSYCISKQMREIQKFLLKSEPDEKKRRAILDESYLWLYPVTGMDYVQFLEFGNTQSALELAGKLLGISASKVAKVVHSRQSRS